MIAASMAYPSGAVDIQALLQRGSFIPVYPAALLSQPRCDAVQVNSW